MMKHYIFTMMAIMTFSVMTAQKPENKRLIEESLTSAPIESQYDIMVQKSPVYQAYKNIRIDYVNKFSVNLKDSIQAYDQKIESLNSLLNQEISKTEQLQAHIDTDKATIDGLNKEKESFEVFGIMTTKSTYSSVMFGVIVILLVALLLFIYRFNSANSITQKAKQDLKELEEEFDQHRKTALKREQKAMRRLQDEINKNKQA